MPRKVSGIPAEWLIAGAVIIVLFIYLKGRNSNPSNSGSSVANFSANSPLSGVINTGSDIGQLVPNEPGTAPIRNVNGGPQYMGGV